MNADIITLSDDTSESETEKTPKNLKLLDTKKEIEKDHLTYSSKLDELRNKVSSLKRRQTATVSKDDDSIVKKIKAASSSEGTAVVNICSKEPKFQLQSFKKLSEQKFETVIKNIHIIHQEQKVCEKPTLEPEEATKYDVTAPRHLQSQNIVDLTEISTVEAEIFVEEANKNANQPLQAQPENSKKGKKKKKKKKAAEVLTAEGVLNQYKAMMASASQSSEEPQPVLRVIFRDQEIARLFSKSVHEALLEVLAIKDPEINENEKCPPLEMKIWESEIPEETCQLDGESGLFTVDTSPLKAQFTRQLPKYEQLTKCALQEKAEVVKPPEKEAGAGSTIANTCFNCNGNHLVQDCPSPYNSENVNKNRMIYMSQRKPQAKTSRYHVDEEQKFAHLKPGQVSNELRQALGLSNRQLPKHVYLMRMIGYPPGWLEEARITHSGLSLINESSEVLDPGEIREENGKDTFDINKIIEFPGYNVPTSDTFYDESQRYGVSEMQWHHSKEAMIESIGDSAAKAYKRKSMPKPDACLLNDDMEIVEIDNEQMIVLDSTVDCDQQEDEEDKSLLESASQDSSSSRQSLDLSELEAQKQKLLSELQHQTPSTPKSETPKSNFCTPDTSIGKTKSLSMGTPIIESASPFGLLPSADKFSQGISDHLNFENLPDATGKYERMKDIINKVKNVVDQIQQS